MNPNSSATRLYLADVATIRMQVLIPPAPIAPHAPPASVSAFTWQEGARIASDRLRASWALLGILCARFWAMGVTAQDIIDRTLTVALTITRTAPEPRNLTPWRDALVAVTVLAMVSMGILLTATPATAHIAANMHPCAAYHWPHQAPASAHCATLKAPKKAGK